MNIFLTLIVKLSLNLISVYKMCSEYRLSKHISSWLILSCVYYLRPSGAAGQIKGVVAYDL